MKPLFFIKKSGFILLAIALFFGLSLACGCKDKTAEVANTASNALVSVKADTLFQNDISHFDFNAYLEKQHYEALDSGKSLIIVHPNAAFFGFVLEKKEVPTSENGSQSRNIDSLLVVRFSKIKDKWERLDSETPYPVMTIDDREKSELIAYRDMNGDGVRDILLNLGRYGDNTNYICYLQGAFVYGGSKKSRTSSRESFKYGKTDKRYG